MVCVKMVDPAGNIGYGSSSNFIRDTAFPSISSGFSWTGDAADLFLNDSEKTGSTALLTAAVSSETATKGYSFVAGAEVCDGRLTYSPSLPTASHTAFTADGNYKACLKMEDAAGNIAYLAASLNLTRDTLSPTLSSGLVLTGDAIDAYLNNAERSGTSALVTAAVATEISTYRFVVVAASTSCSSATGYASGIPFGNNADFGVDGSYKICVELTDSAGNKGYSGSSTIQLDTVAPTASTTLINAALDSVISGSELASNALAMAAAATGSETLSASVYKLMLSSETCGASIVFSSAIPAANSADFGSDGNYKICMKVTDSAGNVGYSASPTIALDTTAPTFSASIALVNEASDGYVNNAEKDAVNNLISSVSSSGATATSYVVLANSATCSSVSGYGSTIPKTNDAAMTSDGSWKVCVKLSDNAGNTAYSSSVVIVRDLVSPILSGGLALQVPAADAYLNAYDRISSNPLVSIATINESGSVEYTVSSGSCSSASGYVASVPTANTNGITGDGTWKVCVKMTDSAGNIAYDNSSEILVDTSGPAFTSLGLANAASNGYVTLLETAGSTDLAGSLLASGYVTVDYKLVSASTTCGSPLVFGVLPKSDSSDFSGDGSYKVCARLVDSAGNMSFGSTGSFILDTAAPSFTSLALANTALDGYLNSSDRSAGTGITGTLTASGQDTATYKIALASVMCSMGLLLNSLSIPLRQRYRHHYL
ncbi:MAG: hypothetical protein EBU49_05500 [Proteobacteria bacterium]|nr:hypothetical protein [Pseudomonadota bacterium]